MNLDGERDWKRDGMDQVLVSMGGGGGRACLGCIHSLALGCFKVVVGLRGDCAQGRSGPTEDQTLGPQRVQGTGALGRGLPFLGLATALEKKPSDGTVPHPL